MELCICIRGEDIDEHEMRNRVKRTNTGTSLKTQRVDHASKENDRKAMMNFYSCAFIDYCLIDVLSATKFFGEKRSPIRVLGLKVVLAIHTSLPFNCLD